MSRILKSTGGKFYIRTGESAEEMANFGIPPVDVFLPRHKYYGYGEVVEPIKRVIARGEAPPGQHVPSLVPIMQWWGSVREKGTPDDQSQRHRALEREGLSNRNHTSAKTYAAAVLLAAGIGTYFSDPGSLEFWVSTALGMGAGGYGLASHNGIDSKQEYEISSYNLRPKSRGVIYGAVGTAVGTACVATFKILSGL